MRTGWEGRRAAQSDSIPDAARGSKTLRTRPVRGRHRGWTPRTSASRGRARAGGPCAGRGPALSRSCVLLSTRRVVAALPVPLRITTLDVGEALEAPRPLVVEATGCGVPRAPRSPARNAAITAATTMLPPRRRLHCPDCPVSRTAPSPGLPRLPDCPVSRATHGGGDQQTRSGHPRRLRCPNRAHSRPTPLRAGRQLAWCPGGRPGTRSPPLPFGRRRRTRGSSEVAVIRSHLAAITDVTTERLRVDDPRDVAPELRRNAAPNPRNAAPERPRKAAPECPRIAAPKTQPGTAPEGDGPCRACRAERRSPRAPAPWVT